MTFGSSLPVTNPPPSAAALAPTSFRRKSYVVVPWARRASELQTSRRRRRPAGAFDILKYGCGVVLRLNLQNRRLTFKDSSLPPPAPGDHAACLLLHGKMIYYL